MAIVGPNINYIKTVIKELSSKFDVKDLGPIQTYLGIDIIRDKNSIILNQKNYLEKVLKRFNATELNPNSIPMDPKFNRESSKDQAKIEDITWYQSAIGSLLYAALITRPDIIYAVATLERYASNPNSEHILAIKKIFRYLKGTLNYGIKYSKDSKNSEYLVGFSDSDFAGEKTEYKSTSGYIFYLANGPISYQSKLQSITAQSSTEAEYIALCNATKEAIFLRELLLELGYFKQEKIPIYFDNNGAIQLAKNPIFHGRTKHINIRYHLIRQKLKDNTISIHFIDTNNQKADGLTKPLNRQKFNIFLKQLEIYKCAK